MILPAAASSVKLAWNPNLEPNISNYRLSYGTSSRSYTQNVDAGTATTATVSGLEQGKTYYFAVRAINDKGLQSEPSAEVSLYVEIAAPVNQAPVASGQSVSTNEDTAVAITLSASDPDGDSLAYTIVNGPTMGSLSGTAPNLTYTPHADANGSDSFTFRVNDGQVDSNTATISISVTSINDTPIAIRVMDRSEWIVTVSSELGNDFLKSNAIDGRTDTYWHSQRSADAAPHWIAVNLGSTQSIKGFRCLPRLPEQNLSNRALLRDWEMYVSDDGAQWGHPVATGQFPWDHVLKEFQLPFPVTGSHVKIQMVTAWGEEAPYAFQLAELNVLVMEEVPNTPPQNQPPIALAASVSTDEDVAVAITLSASDPDGDSLAYTIVNGPTMGRLSGTAPNLIYTPHADANGSDSFTFRVNDGRVDSNTATVTIQIAPAQQTPAGELIANTGWRLLSVSSEETSHEDGSATNAFDGNSGTFWHSRWSSNRALPPHEILIDLGKIESIGGFRYLPRQDSSNNGNIGQYEFHISADGVNWGSPVASGTFPNNQSEKEVLFTARTGRYIMLRALSDANGDVFCCVAELKLLQGPADVSTPPPNEAPVADSRSVTTPEDQPLQIQLVASDGNGDKLTYHIVSQPGMGTLSGTAPSLTYTPHADANGNDSFTFRVNDGTANSNTATISISVTPVNDAPIAAAQLVTTAEDTAVGILLSATDKDGDSLTYRIVSSPTKGTLSGTAPNLIYTPHPNVHGTDSFSFHANDGTVVSNTATVSITITPVNDAPVAAAQLVTTTSDQAVPINLSATDADGDPLTFRLVSSPIKGRLSGSAPSLIYTPNPDASGSDSFSFRANDGKLDSNTATVSISITAPEKAENAAPVFQSAKISREGGKTDAAYTAESLAGTATDPDGDAVSYAKTAGPEWLLVSADGGLSGTPPQEAAGLNTFTIRASDPEGASADAILEIEIQSGDLPLPWTMARIGEIRTDSTASGDGSSITITSSGILSATQDNQLLTWQTLIGDGDVTARVTAIENAANHTLVGVAIRESLAPNSRHAFMGVTPKGGFTLLRRTSTGGQSSRTNSGSGTLPSLWVRLVRKGNIITAFRSTDGSRWMAVSRTNLSLGASCYIGLAVYGGSDAPTTAVFDKITITP